MAQMTMVQRFIGHVTEFFSTASNDIITRVRSITRRWRSSFRSPTHDWARSDYGYYDRLYYGRVSGLELSGLLIKPIVSKLAAWTLGRAPKWKLDSESSQQALADWWTSAHPDILRAWRGALKQADAFVVVNSDLTLTLVPPDAVDPIVDEADYANVIGWRVTQVLTHPETTRRMTVEDEYYVERRIHRVTIEGIAREEIIYPNLLGRLPLVHIANQVGSGQTFGHAEAEALLPLLHRYGEVFDAAIEGNILQGRPTPVLTFETVQDLEKFDSENATIETQQLPNGTSQRVKTYEVDLSQLLVASGATFSYESPGSFTTDTAQLLEILFYLILEHSELPEFVFGNAISSSKASAEVQLPIFIRFIEARRSEMVAWLTDIAEIALGYLALTTPGVTASTPTLQWEELDSADGTLTLETVKWAYAEGLVDELTALQLMPVTVEDAPAVLVKAKAEREQRRQQAQAIAAAQTPADEEDEESEDGVTEMHSYRDVEAEGIVGAAVKILTEGVYANGHHNGA